MHITTWIKPYMKRSKTSNKLYVVKGHLKKLNNPTKSFGDHARELAQDLGYSVTRARRAMELGIEYEHRCFVRNNPWLGWKVK